MRRVALVLRAASVGVGGASARLAGKPPLERLQALRKAVTQLHETVGTVQADAAGAPRTQETVPADLRKVAAAEVFVRKELRKARAAGLDDAYDARLAGTSRPSRGSSTTSVRPGASRAAWARPPTATGPTPR